MANLNKVFLIGNLTRDPELRYTQSGTAVVNFGLAVNREFTSKDTNEKRKDVCFVEIEAWGRQAEVLNQYMKKGRPIFIEGRLNFRQWEDRSGQKRNKLNVVVEGFQFLGGGRGAEAGPQAAAGPQAGTGPQPETDAPPAEPPADAPPKDDDIPF